MNHAHITPEYAPSAWLDLNALDHNIEIVNKKTQQVNLRIASKSVRSIEVLQYIKDKTPNFIGLMSYAADESVHLLEHGFDNIICAYPTFDAASIVKTFAYTNKGATMVWMVDTIEHWQLLEDLGRRHKTSIQVCLDINMSMPLPKLYFGTKRSSLMKRKQLKQLLAKGKLFKYAKISAVMGYEAQIAGLPEMAPNKTKLAPIIRGLKVSSKKQVSRRRQSLVNWLRRQGINLAMVNGGGSGSMDYTCAQTEITEITVGSAYYFPALFSYMDSMQAFKPAAGFVLQVTRQPENNVITCHSGGFIASGSYGADKQPVVLYPDNLSILPDEGFGEVQTPMEVKGKNRPNIEDYVWCRHAKAGELCEHFHELIAYRGDSVEGQLITYRGEGKAFH